MPSPQLIDFPRLTHYPATTPSRFRPGPLPLLPIIRVYPSVVKHPLCVFAVDPRRPWENPCRNSSTSSGPSTRRLVAFPRQSHRGAVWIGRQRHSRPWMVFAVICGRGSQAGRCDCFQMCLGPFPVGGGVSQARANALWPKLETVDFRSQRCGVWPVRELSSRRERTECTTIRPS